MNTAIQALTVLLPIGYLSIALLYSVEKRSPLRRGWILVVLLLHGLLFGLKWQAMQHFPVVGRWSVFSAQAWLLAVLYLWIRFRVHHSGTASLVFGVTFLLQLWASCLEPLPVHPPFESTGSTILAVHVLTSLVASSTLVLSGIHGVLYLVVYKTMQRRQYSAFVQRLPDLQLLSSMTRGAALAGFVLLGVGLNMGIWWAHSAGVSGFSYRDPFVVGMIGLWLHFGLVAFSGSIPGLNARRASWAATFGFLFMLAGAVAAALPNVSFHS